MEPIEVKTHFGGKENFLLEILSIWERDLEEPRVSINRKIEKKIGVMSPFEKQVFTYFYVKRRELKHSFKFGVEEFDVSEVIVEAENFAHIFKVCEQLVYFLIRQRLGIKEFPVIGMREGFVLTEVVDKKSAEDYRRVPISLVDFGFALTSGGNESDILSAIIPLPE